MKKIFLLHFLLLLFSGAFGQLSRAFTFDVGRIDEDPITGLAISSPYIRCSVGQTEKWLIYDPRIDGGTFNSVVSSFSGVSASGHLLGNFKIGNETVRADENLKTAVVITMGLDADLDWYFTHNSKFGSDFLSSVKLKNGHLLVSGYEYSSSSKSLEVVNALLICLDKRGEELWSIKVPGGNGNEVKVNSNGDIFWHVLISKSSFIYKVDHETGTFLDILEEKEEVKNITFNHLFTNDLITLRSTKKGDQVLSRYNSLSGNIVWTKKVGSGALIPTGIEMNPKHNQLLLCFSTHGDYMVNGVNAKLGENNASRGLLLMNVSMEGTVVTYEQYQTDEIVNGGFFTNADEIGVVGSHIGALNIHHNYLPFDNRDDLPQAFFILLSEPLNNSQVDELIIGESESVIEPLFIYPNPAGSGETVSIRLEASSKEELYSVAVYDNHAKLKVEFRDLTLDVDSEVSISLEPYPSGVYHVYLFEEGELPLIRGVGRLIIAK